MSRAMKEQRGTSLRRFKPYPAYKDSGVEWLGEIPAHWEVKKVKRLCLVRRGASPRPIDDPIYFDDDGEYSWVRIAKEFRTALISAAVTGKIDVREESVA